MSAHNSLSYIRHSKIHYVCFTDSSLQVKNQRIFEKTDGNEMILYSKKDVENLSQQPRK